jgi:hypothetical protein
MIAIVAGGPWTSATFAVAISPSASSRAPHAFAGSALGDAREPVGTGLDRIDFEGDG